MHNRDVKPGIVLAYLLCQYFKSPQKLGACGDRYLWVFVPHHKLMTMVRMAALEECSNRLQNILL